jgi:hypothetical protein
MLGTNASKMVIKGNAKTGEYIFYAEDLNQSDSFGKAADVVRVVKQTEAMVDLSKSAVTEAGSVVDTVIQ